LGEKVKSHLNYDHRYKKGWARRIDRNPKMRNLLTQKKLEKKKKKNIIVIEFSKTEEL
jgi:hypothetical protein